MGETFIEQGLQRAGYQIMRPEDHSLTDQIAAYRQAEQIILSESSALHLMAIYCGPNTKIALIKRRPVSPRAIATVETSFAGAKPHYISAFKAYWNHGLALDANDRGGVAVLDFSYLWQYLAEHEFIDKPRAMPHPDEAEIEKERLEVAADRDFRFDLVPGAKYGKRGSKNLA